MSLPVRPSRDDFPLKTSPGTLAVAVGILEEPGPLPDPAVSEFRGEWPLPPEPPAWSSFLCRPWGLSLPGSEPVAPGPVGLPDPPLLEVGPPTSARTKTPIRINGYSLQLDKYVHMYFNLNFSGHTWYRELGDILDTPKLDSITAARSTGGGLVALSDLRADITGICLPIVAILSCHVKLPGQVSWKNKNKKLSPCPTINKYSAMS